MGRPESRHASATNRPMNPVEPTIRVRPVAFPFVARARTVMVFDFYANLEREREREREREGQRQKGGGCLLVDVHGLKVNE